MYRWDIINHLITKNNYKSYLEIGYYKGWSFDNVKCDYKVAVDPNPSKTPEQQNSKMGEEIVLKQGFRDSKEYLCKSISDDFFNSNRSGELGPKWDIIFIDGLHEASQVMKDVANSIKHLSPGGTIVLHDCNPPTYEHTTTGVEGCWTGDVYKVAIKLAGLGNQPGSPGNFYTVDTDWGVGILTINDAAYFENIGELSSHFFSWEDFEPHRKKRINLISVNEFKAKINEGATNNHSTAQ
jgi:Methyltransferase domain